MAYFHSVLKRRTLCAFVFVLSLSVWYAPESWTRNKPAQAGPLTVDYRVVPGEGGGEITVKDPANPTRIFEKGKFKTVLQTPAGIVKVPLPTEDNGTFKVTALKSGKTRLTIKYEDGPSVLEGSIDIAVPYNRVGIRGVAGDPLKLFRGEHFPLNAEAIDIKGNSVQNVTANFTSSNEEIIKIDPVGNAQVAVAQATGSAAINIEVDGAAYPPVPVQVVEAIDRIEVNGVANELSVTIPEDEQKDLDFNLVGKALDGTGFKAEDVVEIEATNSSITQGEWVNDGKTYRLTANPLPPNTTSARQTITFRVKGGGAINRLTNEQTDVEMTVHVTVIQSPGRIKLDASNILLIQNGRVTIKAEVLDRNGSLVRKQPDVEFTLRNGEKDAVWVNLVTEGNQATLVWRNPTEDDIKEQNDGKIVTRPPEIVVIATAQIEIAGLRAELKSEIVIGMGEVEGFDFVKVKLNLMDERTASDLYGKVTSDEYYVLTVRLFNDLKDRITKELTGNSILAYSSSIEVAVGLEKRYNGDADSFFPNVISKGEANKLARKRAEKAVDLANRRADIDIASTTEAQTTLNQAVTEQYEARKNAIRELNEALEKRAEAEAAINTARTTRTSGDKARANRLVGAYNDAMIEARAALERADASEQRVEKLRRAIARSAAAASRVGISKDISSYTDLNTVINDGKWHPVTKYDLERIGPVPEPTPTTKALEFTPLAPLRDEDLQENPASAPAPEPSPTPIEEKEDEDPPCFGVITYRPFTFEMMVNTVDRREGRSRRSKIFRVLDFIGTGTSFVTSFAVPGQSSDLPLGLEKYRNLLLPGLDKIFPDNREEHRQNIVSQAMKEIEEIPFGSDITRVIFIPKRRIHGLIRGHDVRISEVCPFFFRVQVALIKKSGTLERGTIAR